MSTEQHVFVQARAVRRGQSGRAPTGSTRTRFMGPAAPSCSCAMLPSGVARHSAGGTSRGQLTAHLRPPHPAGTLCWVVAASCSTGAGRHAAGHFACRLTGQSLAADGRLLWAVGLDSRRRSLWEAGRARKSGPTARHSTHLMPPATPAAAGSLRQQTRMHVQSCCQRKATGNLLGHPQCREPQGSSPCTPEPACGGCWASQPPGLLPARARPLQRGRQVSQGQGGQGQAGHQDQVLPAAPAGTRQGGWRWRAPHLPTACGWMAPADWRWWAASGSPAVKQAAQGKGSTAEQVRRLRRMSAAGLAKDSSKQSML
jgi:hypothetical protein